MKVVIDTNVVVSAAFKNKDPEAVLRAVVAQPEWEWVVSAEILDEYREVLARPKFGLPPLLLRQWIAFLETVTVLVEVPDGLAYQPDPTDAKFLACALAAQADWLVTGDRDFTQARKLLTTTILSVSQFKTLVCDRTS
ncbi:MAG: putative toxin-antitoxin system toxin component, PIN family [Nitrospira sp.]|jgi:putative PIN family toxin of toxin-antitoxin system|nr:putative toxin-antitoxin system toxin component, PIN family [Nitrospira sp.]MDH4244744.1 putative toxin-antitoxin system toxin component, PIN family [Nitrospira sp.]MDH4354645.1 putative toxin-antitoxin system toxin component, PIN family [Nitrospira sp.]MDH5317672.1 putative toxin-antitoxin system toxin component, PIN family [Nitrospira sp.]